MKKIKKISIEGNYDTRRVTTPDKWAETRAEFRPQVLPSWDALERIDDNRTLWLLLRDMYITILFVDDSWLQFKFKRGMLWDQASVPVFKNNDVQEIIAALVHDSLFSLHFFFPHDNNMGFREANKLFKEITYYYIAKMDKNWFQRCWLRFKARSHFRIVNSIFGRARYEKDSPRRAFWHKKVVSFTCSRIGEYTDGTYI